MSEIVERLVMLSSVLRREAWPEPLVEEAAAEIERLRAENEKLRSALKAVCLGVISERESIDCAVIEGAAVRAAAAALKETGDE